MTGSILPTTNQVCATPNCGKKLCARGFCVACYYRHLRHGDFNAGQPTKKWKHRLSDIDKNNKTAMCAFCGPTKILSRGKGQWRCSTDVNLRSRDYKRAYRAAKKAQLLDRCEICGTTEKLCWDHDHKTLEFRGTLCGTCNAGIGLLKDNPELCINAANYLSKKR